jgi:putative SOS response-associated peptidase YedK
LGDQPSAWRDECAMTDSNAAVRPVHDRLPVLLLPEGYDRWLRGSLDDVIELQKRAFPDELIDIRRTSELWVKKASAPTGPVLL